MAGDRRRRAPFSSSGSPAGSRRAELAHAIAERAARSGTNRTVTAALAGALLLLVGFGGYRLHGSKPRSIDDLRNALDEARSQ